MKTPLTQLTSNRLHKPNYQKTYSYTQKPLTVPFHYIYKKTRSIIKKTFSVLRLPWCMSYRQNHKTDDGRDTLAALTRVSHIQAGRSRLPCPFAHKTEISTNHRFFFYSFLLWCSASYFFLCLSLCTYL